MGNVMQRSIVPTGGLEPAMNAREAETGDVAPKVLAWRALPASARTYLVVVMLAGGCTLAAIFPRTLPPPALFSVLLVLSWLTSAWKINLPISLTSGSTLSMSYAANLMALLLLGPRHAAVVAVAGVFTQCNWNVRQPYPLYRTIFSMAAESITMAATGVAFTWLRSDGFATNGLAKLRASAHP